MVSLPLSRTASFLAALSLSERKRSREKAAKEPPAASIQAGPELCSREMSTRPEKNKTGLSPRIALHSLSFVSYSPGVMLPFRNDMEYGGRPADGGRGRSQEDRPHE